VFQNELYNGIPDVTVWRLLRKRLHLKAYKLSIVQRLELDVVLARTLATGFVLLVYLLRHNTVEIVSHDHSSYVPELFRNQNKHCPRLKPFAVSGIIIFVTAKGELTTLNGRYASLVGAGSESRKSSEVSVEGAGPEAGSLLQRASVLTSWRLGCITVGLSCAGHVMDLSGKSLAD
jgi:hypothetical protein